MAQQSNSLALFLKNSGWIVLVIVLFAVIYATALHLDYIEGDDASTVTYHIMGRDRDFQPPYAQYAGMMDRVLSLLPGEEPVIRVGEMLLNSVTTVTMVIVMLMLIYDFLPQITGWQRWATAGLMLLAAPEFFYFGLVYSSGAASMTCIILAHLLLRRSARAGELMGRQGLRPLLISLVSLVLFGIGVAFRWNLIVCGAVIVVDLLFTVGGATVRPAIWRRLFYGVVWGLLALVSSIGFIVLSGFDLNEIAAVIAQLLPTMLTQRGAVYSEDVITIDALLSIQSLVTPVIAVTGLIGFIAFLIWRRGVALVVIIGVLSAASFILSGVPKFIMAGIPVMMLCAVMGLYLVLYHIKPAILQTLVRVAIVIVVAGMWLIGVEVTQEGTSWGPGFEARTFDREETEGMDAQVVFGSGVAFPTPEGVRPLYGHAHVLLFGGWREFYTEINAEYDRVLAEALENNLPIIVMRWSPDVFANCLVESGFTTQDRYANYSDVSDVFTVRRFTDESGKTVEMFYGEVAIEIDSEGFNKLLPVLRNQDRAVLNAYSSEMRFLYQLDPTVFGEPLGYNSAVVETARLADELEQAMSESPDTAETTVEAAG